MQPIVATCFTWSSKTSLIILIGPRIQVANPGPTVYGTDVKPNYVAIFILREFQHQPRLGQAQDLFLPKGKWPACIYILLNTLHSTEHFSLLGFPSCVSNDSVRVPFLLHRKCHAPSTLPPNS